MVEENVPDLVLLDWMLPSLSGVEVCRRMREKDVTRSVPIIMLTARGEESDKVKGLDSGADDYIAKPFSPRELIARIHAVLRRTRPVLEEKKLEYAGIEIDLDAHRVLCLGKQVHLGPKEFYLLCRLMERPGMVYSREQLLDSVWGQDAYVDVRTVDVHIRRIRKVLEEAAPGLERVIRTVRAAGYTIDKPGEDEEEE